MSLAEGTSDNEHTRSTQEEDQNSQTPTGTKKKNDKRQVSGIFGIFLQILGGFCSGVVCGWLFLSVWVVKKIIIYWYLLFCYSILVVSDF